MFTYYRKLRGLFASRFWLVWAINISWEIENNPKSWAVVCYTSKFIRGHVHGLLQVQSYICQAKLCNQVPSLSLSRWRTLTLLKISIGWVFWCFKLQTIVSNWYWEEYCESMQSWLLSEVWNIKTPTLLMFIGTKL